MEFDTLYDACKYFRQTGLTGVVESTVHGVDLTFHVYSLSSVVILTEEILESLFSLNSQDGPMQVLIGDTIQVPEDLVLTPKVRCKGFCIFCNKLIVNGEVSMNARGANAVGQDVYLFKNEDDTYEYVPAAGAVGNPGGTAPWGTSGAYWGATGYNGTGRQTGSGGVGPVFTWKLAAHSGSSGAGTSYSGGTGSGSYSVNLWVSHPTRPLSGAANGGAGGNGYYDWDGTWAGTTWGGVGNPGGYGWSRYDGGSYYWTTQNSGTGGLLIIYSHQIEGSGVIAANGVAAAGNGGSSGGGSVNIFLAKGRSLEGVAARAVGGQGGSWGGNGTVTVQDKLNTSFFLFKDQKDLIKSYNNSEWFLV